MTRTAGACADLPAPAGPYSPSVRTGPWIHTSGQGGATPAGVLADDVTIQTAQCLDNVMAALAASGANEADIAKVTVYLTDSDHFAAMNDVYRARFSEPYPARTTVFVGLMPGLLVEIDAVAFVAQETPEPPTSDPSVI
jgi:2-iminobutanoate/2-iminopropanoate deaminase